MNSRRCLSQVFVTLWLAAALLTACGPTPTPSPFPTPTPSPTPAPTLTPTPLPLAEWVEEGDTLLQHSDFAGAEAAYQRAIETAEDYAPAYVGLSRTYLWQVEFEDDALAQAQKAVELAPDSAEAHAALAQAQIVQEDPGEAVAAGEQAAELDEENAVAQAVLANAYLLDRQYEAAQQAAEQAVALDPELAKAYHSLGLFYLNTADFARARAAFEQAIALEPTFAPWHITLGNLWLRSEKYDQATACFEKALELAPDYVTAILYLASVDVERMAYEEAEAQIQRAIELAPHAPNAYVAWGYLYLAQDEPDEALEQFRQALDKEKDDYRSQVGLGNAYLRQEVCDVAARHFQELMTTQSRFTDGQIGLGYARLCEGDLNKALENFRKALDLEPYNASSQMGMGSAYTLQGRWEEGDSAYVQALRLSPAGTDIHNYIGHAFRMQGEIDSAEAEYKVALELNPDSIEAHLGLGDILVGKDKSDKAQTHAEQALALDETNRQAQQLLGVALIIQEEVEEGVEILEEIVEEEPENAYARFFLGMAYRDLEQYSQAKKELETFLALFPESSEQQKVEYLIQALEQGYELTEEKAASDLAEILEYLLEEEPDVSVEEIEGEGRTLVVSLNIAPGQEQEELMSDASIIAGASTFTILRIVPPVENGLLINLNTRGRPTFTVQGNFQDFRKFASGFITPQDFAGRLRFSRADTAVGLTPIKKIESETSEIRELDAETTVPHESFTSEELGERLTSSMDAQAQQSLQTSESLLTLLGLIEPDLDLAKFMIDLYTEQVNGFYEPEEKAFYVLEDGEQTAMDQLVIAHEYVHALQDQHFGLERIGDESMNADQRRAFRALAEGDATLSMYLYADEHVPLIDLLQFYSRAGGFEQEVLDASPSFIQGMELFPYQDGLNFVIALYDSGGWEAVNEAYENPPQSTEQVLHPERYREEDEPQSVSLPDLTAELEGDWEEAENGVLGELGLRLALAQHAGPGAAKLAAEGWGGDRYVLLQRGGEEQYALVMRTYWDDQDEADEFWALYRVCMAHRADYTEEVEELIGVAPHHWWASEANHIALSQNERYVDIVLGPDEETVSQIMAALAEQ